MSRHVEEIDSAAMPAAKRLVGDTPELNPGECITCTPLPHANKAAYSGLETQRRHYQKSKTGIGISVAHKNVCPPILFLKKRQGYC